MTHIAALIVILMIPYVVFGIGWTLYDKIKHRGSK